MDLSSFTKSFHSAQNTANDMPQTAAMKKEKEDHNALLLKIGGAVGIITIFFAIGIYFMIAPSSGNKESIQKNSQKYAASDPLVKIFSEDIQKNEGKEIEQQNKDQQNKDQQEKGQQEKGQQEISRSFSLDSQGKIENKRNEDSDTLSEKNLETNSHKGKDLKENKFPSLDIENKKNENLEDFFNDADRLIEENKKEREREKKEKNRILPIEISLPKNISLKGSYVIASGGEEDPLDFPQKEITVQPVLDLVILMETGKSIPFLASPVFGEQEKIVLSIDTTAIAYLSTYTGLYAEKISAEEKRKILLQGVQHKKFPELQDLTKKQVSKEFGINYSNQIRDLAIEILEEVRKEKA